MRYSLEDGRMNGSTYRKTALYVDRSSRQWVLRDPEGNFWILPSGDEAWERRQPYEPKAETDLEPVPSHYTNLLRLPF